MPFGTKKSSRSPEFEAGPSIAETRTGAANSIVAGCSSRSARDRFVLVFYAGAAVARTRTSRRSPSSSRRGPSGPAQVAPDDSCARSPERQHELAGDVPAVDQVVGRTPGVTILQGQLVTSNLFTFSAGAAAVAILGPDENVTPDWPNWRAVSIAVPDDRAVAA